MHYGGFDEEGGEVLNMIITIRALFEKIVKTIVSSFSLVLSAPVK